jgi:antitoxin HigA-1
MMNEIAGDLHPLHPGEVLREEFMVPHHLSAGQVAKACRVPRNRIERIIREEVAITADTALRLERLFGSSAAFWLGLQADYDLEAARPLIAAEIDKIDPIAA